MPDGHSNVTRVGGDVKLSELIRAHRTKTRDTWGQMAERAAKAGHSITQQHIGRIANNGLKEVPTSDTIRAIAAALDEDAGTIYRAAGEELGFRVEGPFEAGDKTLKAFLALTADRSPAEIAALLAVLQAEAQKLDLYRPTSTDVTERPGSEGRSSEEPS